MVGGFKSLAFEGGANIGFVDGFAKGEGEDLPEFVAGIFDVSGGATVLLGDGNIPLTVEYALKDGGLEVGEVFAGLLVDDAIEVLEYRLPIHT